MTDMEGGLRGGSILGQEMVMLLKGWRPNSREKRLVLEGSVTVIIHSVN